jgi:hypothetical protein
MGRTDGRFVPCGEETQDARSHEARLSKMANPSITFHDIQSFSRFARVPRVGAQLWLDRYIGEATEVLAPNRLAHRFVSPLSKARRA